MEWEVKKLSEGQRGNTQKTFSDGGVVSAGDDVIGDISAADYSGDGLRDRREQEMEKGVE